MYLVNKSSYLNPSLVEIFSLNILGPTYDTSLRSVISVLHMQISYSFQDFFSRIQINRMSQPHIFCLHKEKKWPSSTLILTSIIIRELRVSNQKGAKNSDNYIGIVYTVIQFCLLNIYTCHHGVCLISLNTMIAEWSHFGYGVSSI